MRALDGKSGVYVIRQKGSLRVVYVGQSYTGRLKKTLVRHFQRWKGHTAGFTYRRGSVEVCVLLLPRRPALIARVEQKTLIKFRPRDNETGWPDEVPF